MTLNTRRPKVHEPDKHGIKMSNVSPSDPAITSAMLDIRRAATNTRIPWAIVGGQALIAYGVPITALFEPPRSRERRSPGRPKRRTTG